MFQGLLENLLQKVIGEYVEAIDPKKLNMSVYSGVVDLQDLNLKKNIFSKVNLPIRLVIGRIKRLFVRVPWNALSSTPVQIEIQGLQLLIEPLENSEWEQFAEGQNKFEILEKALIQHSMQVFQDLVKKQEDPNSAHLEEQQGFLMALTSKVIDNIQLSIQNIHIRFEDSKNFREPLSLGLTMEKLDIETTNEFWLSEFIDRTNNANKFKPLQKIISLQNIGFYCNPKDSLSNQISQIEELDQQYLRFSELFTLNQKISELYKNSYISRPISSLTKLKQLSEHHMSRDQKEPIYQITLEIDSINICILKSQYEALFKVVEYLTDFQTFTDNFQNKRAIQLQKFYTKKDDFEKNKEQFCEALLRMVTKEVKIFSYQGQPIPQQEEINLKKKVVLEPAMAEIYTSLVSFENNLRLKKWASKIVNEHFTDLNNIIDSQRKVLQQENQSGMINYIGSSLYWLGSGASGAASYLTAQQPPQELKLERFDTAYMGDSMSATESQFDDAEFEDAIDYMPEELDQPQEIQIEESKNEIHRLSVMLYNDFKGLSSEELINKFRSSRQDEEIPIFLGRFHLKQSQISFINDSKMKDQTKDDNEFSEILVFSNDFSISYSHFDAKDLGNKHQIKIHASCKDTGVQLIQREQETSDSENEMETKTHDVIFKMNDFSEDIMDIEWLFGNQNIKESMISQLQSTVDFIDQELNLKFRPITCLYRKEFTEFFGTFFEIKEGVTDEVKLRALEEYEKWREAVSLQNVFENHNMISSNFKLRVELDSSKIILPINPQGEGWIINTGNMVICNNRGHKLLLKCDEGYNPINVDMSKISMLYTENMDNWEQQSKVVLKDLNIGMMIMIRDETFKKFANPIVKPLIKFKITTDEIKLFFNPITYRHLVNIGSCFTKSQNDENTDLRLIENRQIFKDAQIIQLVKKKGNTLQYWYQYVAVFSGSYIYFYPYKDKSAISSLEKNSLEGIKSKKILKSLRYIEYFLVKGCQNVQSLSDYQKEIKSRASISLHNIIQNNLASHGHEIQNEGHIHCQIRMKNSQGQQCILEMQETKDCLNLSSLIIQKANQIDQVLGKQEISNPFRKQNSQIKIQEKTVNNLEQVMGQYDVKFKKFEIVLESTSKIKLKSKCVDKKTRDTIFLSAQQPKQFNRNDDPEEKIYRYSLSLQNFTLGYNYRQFDDDKSILIKSLQIEDKSFENGHKPRFPMLMKTYSSQSDQFINILIKTQNIESPRYNNLLMENEIKIGRIHFNWNPVSFNRVIRFFRFMRYVEEFVKTESVNIQQSFQIKLTNLHSDNVQPQIPQQTPKAKDKRGRSNLKLLEGLDRCEHRTTCQDDSTNMMSVKLYVEKIKIVCIHPQNDSFPVFTKKIDKLKINYDSYQDHDIFDGQIGNFRVLDNTNYPRTLDPYQNYDNNEKIPSHQILGFKISDKEQSVINFNMTLFHYPLDKFCPLQLAENNSQYDKLVKLNMKQLQINHMQEVMFRLNDYFFYQFIYAITDANPYRDIYQRLLVDLDPFLAGNQTKANKEGTSESSEEESGSSFDESPIISEPESRESARLRIRRVSMAKEVNYESSISEKSNEQSEEDDPVSSSNSEERFMQEEEEDEANVDIPDEEDYSFQQVRGKQATPGVLFDADNSFEFKNNYESFDLQQYPLTTGLDITLENPLIVLKDRPYFKGNIEIDLGQIKVTSRLEHVTGKWNFIPDKKTFVNIIDIDMKSVRIDYNSKSYMITPPFDMLISLERINYSELLLDQFMSKDIDFEQFNNKEQIKITSTAFEMNFKKEIYTYFLQCLDLNINYYDMLHPGYQLFTWNSQNFMQYLNIEEKQVQKYTNSSVKKRQITLEFPSFSIKINQDNQLLAELILYNFCMEFSQYIDYRKDILLKSQTFYILYKELDKQQFAGQVSQQDLLDPNFKSLIMGPIQSKRNIKTSRVFYNNLILKGLNDFVVDIKMQPDGAKVIDVEMKGLKLFLKIDVLYIISNFFLNSWPVYQNDAKDKPTYFEPDYGNYARFEMVLNLNDCLICFEQMIFNDQDEKKTEVSAFDDHPGRGKSFFSSPTKNKEAEFSIPRNFFTKTVAFQGQLQYHLVREKGNQVKEEILDVPSQEIVDASKNTIQPKEISTQRRLKTQQVHIIDFQPFFCDIKDLDEGGIQLKHIYKRQMISPFNLFWMQNDMIEVVTRNLRKISKIKKSEDMLNDKNFRFFQKSELNLDLAEIQISFNDMVILEGIQMKFDLMNKEFEAHMQTLQPQDNPISSGESEEKQISQKLNQTLAKPTKPLSREVANIKFPQKMIRDPDYIPEECEVMIDSDEENETQSQLRRNISRKQEKELLMTQSQKVMSSHYEAEIVTMEDEEVNKGIDQMQVVSHGLKLIIINDRDNNFLPVLSTNFSHFNVQWDFNQRQSCMWTDLNSSINFFNVNIGVWEPFIERFGVKLMMNEEYQTNKQNISLGINTPFNLNLTEKLIENLYESSNSWNLVSDKFEAFKLQYSIMTKKKDEEMRPFDLDESYCHDQSEKLSDEEEVKNTIRNLDTTHTDPKFNEEIITPYVIVNKTDMAFFVKRLFEKDRRDIAIQNNQKYKRLLAEENEIEANLQKRKCLINQYRLDQGAIIDYMVDYHDDDKFKLTQEDDEMIFDVQEKENIHSDSIGEYKSEFIKIQFETENETNDNFQENREIKKIDLNELFGFRTHILREGKYMEKVFYAVKLVDFKKVFTLRTQTQLVNRTGYDYLIHFRFKDSSIVKYLEHGDSLPLPMRLNESKIQIKLIDSEDKPKTRTSLPEEDLSAPDFRVNFSNWSALIPLIILKDRLNFNEGSYLTNSKSRFTFIRKTKEPVYLMNDKIIDINLMPPLIVKNCLPFKLYLSFEDSSGVAQKKVFEKNEEKNLFCFSMAQSVEVDIFINGFNVKKQFKIFNLENYNNFEDKLEIQDQYGRTTTIYTHITRNESGQRIIFYCKKILIDQLDSQLVYFFRINKYAKQSQEQYIKSMIPFIDQPELKQRLYIIPEGQTEIFASLIDSQDQKDAQKLDIETLNMQIEFKIANNFQNFNFCFQTSIYLATSNEYIYTKITTLNPYYIFVNQSNYNILIEQAEMHHSSNTLDYQLPLILGPKQRHAFNFFNLNAKIPGLDEFIHIKLLDEEITGKDLEELLLIKQQMNLCDSISNASSTLKKESQKAFGQGIHYGLPMKQHMIFSKQYNWSSPFMISEVDNFTMKIHPHVRKQRLQEQMNGLNLQERILLTKIMNEPKYLKVKCKADIKQALGSMFIIIDEEEEDTCQYKIVNESKNLDINYCQHIVNNPMWNERLDVDDKITQKCKAGVSSRFTWDSVFHQKILRVSFSLKGQLYEECDKLQLWNLDKDQELRVIPTSDKSYRDILIPFDKIGHEEEIDLIQEIDMTQQLGTKGQMPNLTHTIRISVATNGYTKFLKIADIEETKNPDANLSGQLVEQKIKMFELGVSQIFISFIHKKCELMTIFINKLSTLIVETEQLKNIKFSIGYLQIDNQAESEPVYPVLLKPRDLYYNTDEDQIVLGLKQETEKEKKEREAKGLATLTSDDAKMFQLNIIINKKSSTLSHDKDVLYIESIMFLLQTLEIKIQFSQFLKLTNFAQHIGKILNKSVNQVHYIFENLDQPAPENRMIADETIFTPATEQSKESLALNNQSFSIKKKRIIDYQVSNKKDHEVEKLQQSLINLIDEPVTPKKQDRLKNFARQNSLKNDRKIASVMMSIMDNNWQLANNIKLPNEWRLFIREYQSSPTELIVSAINERLEKAPNTNIKDDPVVRNLFLDNKKKYDQLHGVDQQSEDDQIQEDGVVGILGALGENIARKILFFSTFEDMEFQMNGMNISNLFGEGNEVMNQLANFHKETFKFNALRLLGSSNLIGNPSRFVNNIGTGVTDFFVKPYQGIKDGGIVKMRDGFVVGSRSLIQNSLMAPVGAMAKISNSISKGTLALSFDDKFIAAKNYEDRRNKPKSVGDGMRKGFASAKASIHSGITDVFYKPIEGAREQGLRGFIRGGARGAAGLVTKTISGGIDIIAKTSEGLDNQSKTQLALTHRIRRPRPFYEIYSIIRPYNEFQAFWITMVPQIKDQLDISNLYDVFQIHEDSKYKKDHQKTKDPLNTKNMLQENKSSIFVITKNLIIEINSVISMPQDRSQAKTSLTINNIFLIKHIDFIEIVGESNNVMLIGFRQSQIHEDQQTPMPQKAVPARASLTVKAPPSLNVSSTMSGKNQFTQQELDDIFNGRTDSIVSISSQSTPQLEKPSIQNHLKKSQSQMSILKEKLTEQVLLQDHTRPHVQSSPFHLHIEFDSAQKAKDIKNILLKVKAVLRKEKSLGKMMFLQSQSQY